MADVLLLAPGRARARSIRSILRDGGHEVYLRRSVDAWANVARELRPELVVAAVDSIDGVLARAGAAVRGFPAPILYISREESREDPFLENRLVDRIATPFMVEELLGRVDALIRVRRVIQRKPVPPLGRSTDTSRGRARPRSVWHRLFGSRKVIPEAPVGPYLEVEARLAEWADRRDAFEPGHAERVASLCAMIAEGLAMEADEVSLLLAAATLHDVGKVALPVELLHQREPLQEHQTQWIRSHPRRGAELLRALDPQVELAETILYHHERPDGSGYYGKWPEVPQTARALAVAEVFDAMISSRVKAPLSREEAIRRLHQMKGQTLDTDCVEALISKLKRRAETIPLSAPTLPETF